MWLSTAAASITHDSILLSFTASDVRYGQQSLHRVTIKFQHFYLQHHAKDQNAAVLGSTEWKAYSARAKAWCESTLHAAADVSTAHNPDFVFFVAPTLLCPYASLREVI